MDVRERLELECLRMIIGKDLIIKLFGMFLSRDIGKYKKIY